MARPQSKTDIIREHCRKWPKHGNLTIAKAVYRKHPQLWTDVEAVRASVRNVRGAHGAHHRKAAADKSLFQPPRKAGEPSLTMPRSIAKARTPHRMSAKRCLILSDLHVPYHDEAAVAAAVAEGIDFGVDGVLLNGDICDFFGCSRWDRDPREVDLANEIEQTKALFAFFRDFFPDAEIVWKEGNHEERFAHYLWKKAPELLSVPNFDMASIFDLQKFNITLVGDKRPVMVGKLRCLHGHEYPKGMTNPVNQARGMFMRGLECALAGHGHRSSEHAESTMAQNVITCWSTGCLCHLSPDYAPINKWNLGFALVEVDEEGAFEVQNKRIVHGKVW